MTRQTLARLGQLLYGPDWTVQLATALGIHERRMRRIRAGQSPCPPIEDAARELVAERMDALGALATELKHNSRKAA